MSRRLLSRLTIPYETVVRSGKYRALQIDVAIEINEWPELGTREQAANGRDWVLAVPAAS